MVGPRCCDEAQPPLRAPHIGIAGSAALRCLASEARLNINITRRNATSPSSADMTIYPALLLWKKSLEDRFPFKRLVLVHSHQRALDGHSDDLIQGRLRLLATCTVSQQGHGKAGRTSLPVRTKQPTVERLSSMHPSV